MVQNFEALVYAIILLIIGLLCLYKPFITWNIRLGNKIRGTKTEITKETIRFNRIIACVLIIFSLVLLILVFL